MATSTTPQPYAADPTENPPRAGTLTIDELAIAVVVAGQPPPDLRQRRRQIPVAERVAVAQRPGLSGQHRQVMPGVVGGLAASEAAGGSADELAVTPDNDAVGIGAQLGSAPRRLNRDAVAVVVEAHQAALRHRDLDLVEAVERARIGDQAGPLGLEDLPDGLVGLLGMHALPRLGEATRLQPGVELGIAGKVQPRRKQVLADIADLVLDLPFLPTRRRRARRRIDQVMRAHPQKAAVE